MTIASKIKRRLYFVAARYFRFFANISLRKWQPRIIAVTGSAGKTTMLGLIESQLGNRAHYSHNANSAFGIAFDILGQKGITASKWHWLSLIFASPIRAFTFRHHEEFYVVEIDGERPFEAEFIARWLKPEISLWVSLGRSHAVFFEQAVKNGRFKSVDDAIAHEFAAIPEQTTKLVIIDGDNPEMRRRTEPLLAKTIAVHRSDLKRYAVCPEKTTFEFRAHTYTFKNPMPREVATQLLMLDALMRYLKLPTDSTLKNFTMPPSRGNYLEGKRGVKIIDSSYNAHLISMASVLDMVKNLHASHKWLIIGDIIDQGQLEGEEHQKLANMLLSAKAEQIVLIGRRTAAYTYPLLKDRTSVVSFQHPKQALEFLERNLTGKETLIFKGSQYLEWIVENLLKNPEDIEKLARQDPAHKKRRQDWGLD